MPTYFWRGNASSASTGGNWGFTGNWLNSLGVGATAFPLGGDTVIFGASAAVACLVGGLTGNNLWIGYTSGDAGATGDIIVRIDNRYSPTNLGFSFGSVTGPLNLKISQLYIGTTQAADICIKNIPGTNNAFAQMDGPSGTFFASGTWRGLIVNRGSLVTQDLTAELISIEGQRGGTAIYLQATEGFGVNNVTIGGGSNINTVVASAKATSSPITINTVTRNTIINAMGITATGFTYTAINQNFRPAGLERSFNEISKQLRFRRE